MLGMCKEFPRNFFMALISKFEKWQHIISCFVYLRTPHIGRTKASDVACPAPSPPSLSPNFSPITTTTKLARLISHQISSPIRCRRDCSFRFLLSLSLRFRFREPLLLLCDSVMCSADEIRFRYLALSPFFLRNSDFPMRFYLLLQSRMSADCAGEASLASGAQTAGAGRHSRLTGREQQLQVMAGRKM